MLPVDPETIKAVAATGTFIGAIVLGFKRAGLVTFGRPVERRAYVKECPNHKSLVSSIETVKTNSEARLEKLNQMDAKIDALSLDIAKVIGYLQGRNGYHT